MLEQNSGKMETIQIDVFFLKNYQNCSCFSGLTLYKCEQIATLGIGKVLEDTWRMRHH